LVLLREEKINKRKGRNIYKKYLPIKTVLCSLILQMLSDHKREIKGRYSKTGRLQNIKIKI
jgi:hypothetical protein